MNKENISATINNTTMEVSTMKNYKEMNWKDVVAYAKELGINTGHKKRIDIELELDAISDKVIEVPVGDMSNDKYYPETNVSAKSLTETNILKAINKASFDATYNNVAVRYIMTKSLRSIIRYNLAVALRTEANINKVIDGLTKNVLYTCNDKFYGVR